MSADPPRPLGVIEAITAARDQCPHEPVRRCAARALEAIREGGADTLREQAFLVLTTTRGWRGERATQVRQALLAFVDPP